MSNNCFYQKLKGEVNNNNLPFMNELRFYCVHSDSVANWGTNGFAISHTGPITIKSVDGTACIAVPTDAVTPSTPLPDSFVSEKTYGTPYDVYPSTHFIAISNSNSEISIISKHNIQSLTWITNATAKKNFGIKDLSQLDYVSGFKTIAIPNVLLKGVLSIKGSALNNINIGTTNFLNDCCIDIDSLPANTYGNFNINGSKYSKGNINSFISRIFGAGNTIPSYMSFGSTQCTGALEGIMDMLSGKGIYTFNIVPSAYVTCKGINTVSANYKMQSSDNGASYVVTNIDMSETIGTYTVSTGTWS
jgi:hypothetical protein